MDNVTNLHVVGSVDEWRPGEWLCYVKLMEGLEYVGFEKTKWQAQCKVIAEAFRSCVVLDSSPGPPKPMGCMFCKRVDGSHHTGCPLYERLDI
jgi:hypothetical protein